MDDMYVKPGNQERGWNDPPQFSYGLQKARGPQRNLLTRRAAPPACDVRAPPMTPPTSSHQPPSQCSVVPPPPGPAGPPVGGVTTPPSLCPRSSQSESEPDVEGVVLVLNRALAACRQNVSDQVCNDVAKRLRLLEDSWRSGRLSLPVRRRMESLSLELQSGHWDSADELHRSLMVDHVTEVSQWMVGVKRLIAEAQKLRPEHLQLVQGPAQPGSVSQP
ncbi:hypothetical protein PAMA_005615 [Pampus argenteus]